MIRLDFTFAIALYVGFFAVGLLFIWVFLDRGKFRKYSSDNKFVWHCNICTHVYIDSTHEYISTCPRCGSYLKRR